MPDSLSAKLVPVLTGNLELAAVVTAGTLAAAVVWRWWPFYRRMLVRHAEAQPSDGRARYDALDGLRGILCLMVAVHHASITINLPGPTAAWGDGFRASPAAHLPGTLAVALFFCATAFLFYARAVERPAAATANLGRFFVGRVFRIGPALLASVPLILLADLTGPRLLVRADLVELAIRAVSLGAHGMTNAQPIVQNAGVFWTLTHEWFFYLAFPALAAMAAARLPVWSRLVACVAVASFAGRRIGGPTPAMFFLGGIVAVHLMDRPAVRRFAGGAAASLTVLWLVAVLPAAAPRLRGGEFGPTAAALVAVIFTLVVAGCDVFGLLRLPALRAVGAASYSVYLFHGIALFALRPILSGPAHGPIVSWAIVCAAMAGVVLVSMASYRWVEHTGIEVGRRLTRKVSEAPRPVVAVTTAA